MRRNITTGLCALFLLLTWTAAHAQQDAENARDNPYLARMENFFIEKTANQDPGVYSFCDGNRVFVARGKLYSSLYRVREGEPRPSMLHIRRHFVKAIRDKIKDRTEPFTAEELKRIPEGE